MKSVKYLGATANDEMCNLYLMYYSAVNDGGFETCEDEEYRDLSKKLPFDSDKLFPENDNPFANARAHRRREYPNIVHPEPLLN